MDTFSLPIDPHLPKIYDAVRTHATVLISAAPGTGKTTRLPPYLMDKLSGKEVWVLEPRRLAAKLSALRVAHERGERIGDRIGYQFRDESAFGKNTRLLYLTEGTFLRRLARDPGLKNVGALCLDEFHERHLETDIALGLAIHRVRRLNRDLKVLILSATLDVEKLQKHLSDCPQIDIPGKLFPIEKLFLDRPTALPLEKEVENALRTAREKMPQGDRLVFLPGLYEIQKAKTHLERVFSDTDVVILHGSLSKDLQEKALGPSSRKKIILSTNIAETSLTIDGVSTVVDAGFQRVAQESPWTGLVKLLTKRICQASAEQRAGRAGRQGPGLALRLYTRHEFLSWPSHEAPEILRKDLSQTLLDLKHLGVEDEEAFPWLDRPKDEALHGARHVLFRLGLIAQEAAGAALTELGKNVASLGVGPRLGRFLWEARQERVGGLGAEVAAHLLDGSADGIDGWAAWKASRPYPRTVQRLQSLVGEGGVRDEATVSRCLLKAFPDRVGLLKVQGKKREIFFCEGGSVPVGLHPLLEHHALFLALSLRETDVSKTCELLVPLETEWLCEVDAYGLEEKKGWTWDRSKERVTVSEQTRYGNLVLEEKTIFESLTESEKKESFVFILKEAFSIDWPKMQEASPREWVYALAQRLGDERVSSPFARWHRYREERSDTTPTAELVLKAGLGLKSLDDWKAIDWNEALESACDALGKRDFRELFPASYGLPGRKKVPVVYYWDRPPSHEARRQDFFGLSTTPSVVQGKLPLTLHILAPNGRAIQVTSDLAGFWKNSYPKVRTELSRRYPKHHWPENPAGSKRG